MTDYQKANRPDLAILDVLSKSVDPITLVEIHKQICAEAEWVSLGALGTANERLVAAGHVTRSYHPRGGDMPVYAITNKGRAQLIVADTHSIFHNHLKEEPVYATVCHRPEVPGDAKAEPAPTALLCVDEDELDAWWNALEVEAKADAFVQWSLGNDGRNSHVYIEPSEAKTVPVTGTIGEQDDSSAVAWLLKNKHAVVSALNAAARAQ